MQHHVILGGIGFIGSNLTKRLLTEINNKVTIIDNSSTGSRHNIPEEFLIHDHYRSRFFINLDCDIVNQKHLFSLLPESDKIDVIWNLACPASPVQYQKNPIQTILTSTQGTHNALRLAYMHGSKFLQASTSEIYGDPHVHPQTEDYWGNVNTWGPRACYDEGKRLGETLCYEYRTMVDVRVVRIFNTYGPKMAVNDGRVVSNFIVQALQNKDITIYGTGSQTRSFCYIDDLARGLRTVVNSPRNGMGPINLGNPVEYKISELAEKILILTNSKAKIVFKDLPKDDPTQRKPDISKAKSLGWEPEVSLEQGLLDTIDYFHQKLIKG